MIHVEYERRARTRLRRTATLLRHPQPAARRPARQEPEQPVRVRSEPVLDVRTRRFYAVVCVLWVFANLVFWCWWLRPERVGTPLLYALFSLAWAYDVSFLPTMYLFFVGRMRRPVPIAPPREARVALVTLCVPAQETLAVIERQLRALVRVEYPHDSWVLDEGDDPSVRAAAARLGVRYFSRRSIAKYNQSSGSFRAKTKAGNVNAWLDTHGYVYDYFVQFDIDHEPRVDYLHQVLGYFSDPHVAWVQAPSVYGNLNSWVARGSAEQELVLQGPLQQGFFGFSETPFIIGSHCTYRTRAIIEIGGFQPTRAEDHLDTVVLATRGYRGVFVPQPIAIGDGPQTFETYLRQQFAWALSMMQVLTDHMPRLWRRCSPRQRLQFLFSQTWYPLWSSSMLVLFAMPALALLTGQVPAHAPLAEFGFISAPLGITAYVAWRWTSRWQQPFGLRVSWRGMILHIARWPIVFWALLNVVVHARHPYMITPKGNREGVPGLPMRTQLPYLLFAGANLGAIWIYLLSEGDDATEGYALLALLGAGFMLTVSAANLVANLLELKRFRLDASRLLRLRAAQLFIVGLAVSTLMVTATASRSAIASGVSWTAATPTAMNTTPGAAAARAVLTAPARASLGGGAATSPMPSSALHLPVFATGSGDAHAAGPHAGQSALAYLDAPGAGSVLFGAYDPWQDAQLVPLGIEHWYVRQDDPGLFVAALEHAARSDRLPLVTIEPFPRRAAANPLERVVQGKADGELRELASVLRARGGQPVLLRWAHEMDLPGLYPWSGTDPVLYREAFRHVVSVFSSAGATNVRWVWSPAGDPGAVAFYPGADVVDYIGLTVLSDAGWAWDMGAPTQPTMSDVLRPRYAELAPLGKPMIIAELGVSGEEEFRRGWLAAAVADLAEFDQVRAVVYFNDRNAPNNQRDKEPDWRLSTDVLELLGGDRSIGPVLAP